MDFVGLILPSFLRRLGDRFDVSTTVSGKGRFLDEDASTLDSGKEVAGVPTTVSGGGRFLDEDSSTHLDFEADEGFFFCFLDFALEEKISSISDMVARKLHCVTSDVTTVRMVLFLD